MNFLGVKIPAASAALAALLLGLPRTVEGQATGILQATVRVVDYGSSLAALRIAGTAVRAGHNAGHAERTHRGSGYIVASRRAGDDEPVLVTITYLH